jgi:hypothetical protein
MKILVKNFLLKCVIFTSNFILNKTGIDRFQDCCKGGWKKGLVMAFSGNLGRVRIICSPFFCRLKRKDAKYLDDYVVIDSQRKKRKSRTKKPSKNLFKTDADADADADDPDEVDHFEDEVDLGNFIPNS